MDDNKEEQSSTLYHDEVQKVKEPEKYAVETILEVQEDRW